jgi:chromosomal replication initiation ATPase DnaA
MTADIGANPGERRSAAYDAETEPMARFVEAVVASAFGIRARTLRAPGRGRAPVAFARQVAIYLAHTRLRLGYSAAGRLFGRDRTTATHACRVIEEKREDGSLDTILDCLERSVDLWLRSARRRTAAR